jgi:hypothetical protein
LAYVPKSKPRATSVLQGDESTFQQHKHDLKNIMKPAEEECDQSDLRLANYAQNSDQRLLLKKSSGLVRPRYRTCPIHPENFSKFKYFFPTLILELRDTKLNTRNTFLNFFPKSKDFPFDFGLTQET